MNKTDIARRIGYSLGLTAGEYSVRERRIIYKCLRSILWTLSNNQKIFTVGIQAYWKNRDAELIHRSERRGQTHKTNTATQRDVNLINQRFTTAYAVDMPLVHVVKKEIERELQR
jgi:hypothetical protein